MSRPVKFGLDYFPLDTDFFANAKIKNLRRRDGAIGVLTYLNILCKVYCNGYYYHIPAGDKESFYADIAEEIASGTDQIRQVTSRVRESVCHMTELELLDATMFEMDIITGISLQEHYLVAASKARSKAEINEYRLLPAGGSIRKSGINATLTPVNATLTPVNATLMPQSKVKESKVNTTTTTAHTRESGNDDAVDGKGVVFLTETEIENLVQEMGESDFREYVDRLSDFIIDRGARVRDHAKTIRQWWTEDKTKRKPQKPPKPRYGNFDPEEAFRNAVARTYHEGGSSDDHG